MWTFLVIAVLLSVPITLIIRRGQRLQPPIRPVDPAPLRPSEPEFVLPQRRINRTSEEDTNITWSKYLRPPELYEIEYADRHGEFSVRRVEVLKMGTANGRPYLGVTEGGKFKTLRADRLLRVTQLSGEQAPSVKVPLKYADSLPSWPGEGAVFRMPTITGSRHWTVNLNDYTCTCPEKRVRLRAGYRSGTLGAVCPHMAAAILSNIPTSAAWDADLVAFLADSSKTSLNALS